MKTDILKQFNLPSYIKNKSFAEASKAIDKKFESRNDKYSKDTKQELLERLAQAQEYLKMQEGLQTMSQEVPVMDDVPKEFAEGGSMADYLNMAPQALNAVTNAFGNTGINSSGSTQYQDVDQVGGTINGAMSGAQAGMALGPMGAIGGALVGGISSLIGGKRKQQDINEANNNFALSQSANLRSDFGNGGLIKRKDGSYSKRGLWDNIRANRGSGKKPTPEMLKQENKIKRSEKALGGSLNDIFSVTPKAQADLNLHAQMASMSNPLDKTPEIPQLASPGFTDPKKEPTMGKRLFNDVKDNLGQIASYAPIAGNLLELNNLNQAVTEPGQRLNNVYNPNYFDQESLINRVNQNNVNRALTESSGGDLGALRNSILAANLNKDKAISEAVIQGDNINRGEDKFKFQSDFNRDRINVGLDQNFINRKDADEAAYESTKSNIKRQIFEDVGDVGKEEINKKLVRDIFGYKWNGKFYVDNKGNKYSPSDVAAKIKVAKENEMMYGGYLKKNK